MTTLLKFFTSALIALSLLSTAGCTSVQGSPNMVDYSYVPQNQVIGSYAPRGLEEF
jgi:hypothetical protein